MEKTNEVYEHLENIVSITLSDTEYILMTDGKFHYYDQFGELAVLEDENVLKKLTDFTTFKKNMKGFRYGRKRT